MNVMHGAPVAKGISCGILFSCSAGIVYILLLHEPGFLFTRSLPWFSSSGRSSPVQPVLPGHPETDTGHCLFPVVPYSQQRSSCFS